MVRIIDTPLHTSDQSIDRVLAAGLPVALLFSTGKLDPGLEQILVKTASQMAGKALIARVEAKDNPASTSRFKVTQLPSMVSFRDGQELTRAEPVNAHEFEQHLAYLLGQGPRPQVAQNKTQESASRTSQDQLHEGHPMAVTDASFEKEVIQAQVPVLVDFWAPWCGPCRMTEPVVEKMASEMAGNLKVVKVNVDENPRISRQYGVQSIPTMLVVNHGKVVDRWVGALPEQAVRSRVRAFLG